MHIIYNIDKGFKPSKPEDLVTEPIVVRVTEFDDKSLDKFITDFNKAVNSGQPVIPVHINSYGGYVDSLAGMMTMIETSPVPVATVCTGWAMSCGLILLAMGDDGKRYIAPNARVMMHEISGGAFGKTKDIIASADEIRRFNKWVFEKISKKCGHKYNYFMDLMHKEKSNTDWYMIPKDVVKYNLADHISVPRIRVTAKLGFEFESVK